MWMFVVAVHPHGSRIESVVLGRLLLYWYVSVKVSTSAKKISLHPMHPMLLKASGE